MAVAGAVLQRDAPWPAGRMRGRPRVGQQRIGALGRYRDGTVARQPLAPILGWYAELLAEEQAAKARAVDEQIAAHPAVVVELHCGDEASLAVLLDLDDLAFDALGAVRL